jgi:oxygen-dependent protoporphyrinogen oxidase
VPLLFSTLARWKNLDHHAFWRADAYDDRSVADVIGKSNEELLEYMLQPMLNGYFYWAPEHVSQAMVYNLCKAALAQGGTYKMQQGLQRIPEKASEGSTVLLGHTVREIHKTKGQQYEVTAEHHGKIKTLKADGIVCATTASVVPHIFADLNKAQKDFFEAVEYSSTAVVARFFEQECIRGDKGIAFPRREGIQLAAITAEPGNGQLASLKAFASGTVGAELCKKSDETIIRELTQAMEPARSAVLAGNPEPLAVRVQRWPEALPFFDVGHFKRLRAFENGTVESPEQAIVFAGDYLGGPFMEGAFTSGMQAATRLSALIER